MGAVAILVEASSGSKRRTSPSLLVAEEGESEPVVFHAFQLCGHHNSLVVV